jgi:uncharacterized peroxidase-related enzyme
MPHIALTDGLAGMRALQTYRPDTAAPMNQLANILLKHSGGLSAGERELIGTYVSSRNDCHYCQSIHGAVAACHLRADEALIRQVKADPESAPISEKMKALLAIAGKVQQGGKHVTAVLVERARRAGATDLELHDTVLIAAAFCMFNRYVDGLASWAPDDPAFYRERGEYLAAHGYSSGPVAAAR